MLDRVHELIGSEAEAGVERAAASWNIWSINGFTPEWETVGLYFDTQKLKKWILYNFIANIWLSYEIYTIVFFLIL